MHIISVFGFAFCSFCSVNKRLNQNTIGFNDIILSGRSAFQLSAAGNKNDKFTDRIKKDKPSSSSSPASSSSSSSTSALKGTAKSSPSTTTTNASHNVIKTQTWRIFNIDVLHENDPGKDSVLLHQKLIEALSDTLRDKKNLLSSSFSISNNNNNNNNCVNSGMNSSSGSDNISNEHSNNSSNKNSNIDITIVKKAFDGRWKKTGQPKWVYTVDLEIPVTMVKKLGLKEVMGKFERMLSPSLYSSIPPSPTISSTTIKNDINNDNGNSNNTSDYSTTASKQLQQQSQSKLILSKKHQPRIVVVGAGPSGLFAAITLVKAGYQPIIIERGEPVEIRGRDIGALFNRKILNEESNLCYGEGGAGTWSDGKLTTRIGKNSDDVRSVLHTLVTHGAPERILIDNKPHLGTDRLVRILKDLRQWLIEKGAVFRFGTKVEDVMLSHQIEGSVSGSSGGKGESNGGGSMNMQRIVGVKLSTGEEISADFVVLAVGHSARQLYRKLTNQKVLLIPKPIAVGFRIEHPQELINQIQYGEVYGKECLRGKGKVPVADYRLATQIASNDGGISYHSSSAAGSSGSSSGIGKSGIKSRVSDSSGMSDSDRASNDQSAATATTSEERSCYSFCMCPGGQIVPTSVNPEELCVNGMSFSQRQSPFANAALVVTVSPEDLGYGSNSYGSNTRDSSSASSSNSKNHNNHHANNIISDDPLIGVLWQQEIERAAAKMGGGSLVAPVQRVTDFLSETPTAVNGGDVSVYFAQSGKTSYYPSTAAVGTSDVSNGSGGTGSGESSGTNTAARKLNSSYRLGVVGAACHTLYPQYVTRALQQAILTFDKQMPGFITPDALLHGVETRTSSPVQIARNLDSLQSVTVAGLYPTGEGAGYAGGIISAAVDGCKIGQKIIEHITGRN